MKCDRSTHLDLAAFLAGESSPDLDEFRAHYPSCPDCWAAVRAWMTLHGELDPQPPVRQHPSEELLLRFETEPEAMSAVARSSVQTHLKACASCRDELQTLRHFDFSILQRPAADAPQTDSGRTMKRRSWWRDFFAPVRQIVLHPAFAYGLVLLLLLPQLSTFLPNQRGFSPQQVRPFVGAPLAESEPAAGVAPRNRQDVPAQQLAEKPGSLSGASERIFAPLYEGDTLRRAESGTETHEYLVAPEPPSFAKERRKTETPAVGQARRANIAGIEQSDEVGQAAGGQVMGKSLSHDATGEPGKVVTIQMDPSGRNNIPMQGMLGGAVLHIKPQQPIRPGSDVAIRIKSADGRRELREIHTASGGDGYLNMTVPPGWMPDGTYSVEVWPLDAMPKNSRHGHGVEAFR